MRHLIPLTFLAVVAACAGDDIGTTTIDTSSSTGGGPETSSAGTVTSTVSGDITSTTVDMSTTGEDSTSTTSDDTGSSTTEDTPPPCNEDGVCDPGESTPTCLHDCAVCEEDWVCDISVETPSSCPHDCPAVVCNLDGVVDLLHEQCDDGNDIDEDACTSSCNHNICGDGILFPPENGGTEECDDGNEKYGDGCTPECKIEVVRVFVSSIKFPGNFAPKIGALQGLDLADAHCQAMANQEDLGGEWVAWLSDLKDGPFDRAPLLKDFAGPVVLVDGTLVATSVKALKDDLHNPILMTEKGSKSKPTIVWSNTWGNGATVYPSRDCGGWSSLQEKGNYGISGHTDGQKWSYFGDTPVPCLSEYQVYCFEDPAGFVPVP